MKLFSRKSSNYSSQILMDVKLFSFKRNFLLSVITVVFASCAQMSEPNGGIKDAKAPEVLEDRSMPKNKTVNFSTDKIILTFNEYIQLKSQQVVITPALANKPEMKVKGKKIEIQFNDKPKANTTYTINFSGAINDITENNTVQNFQYVFSTGPYLDSLSISGKVINAFSQGGIGSSTVILHNAETDSAIVNARPAYYLKTEKDGSFKLSNLKSGKYNLYSLNDKNADLMFNGYPEEISFLDSVIVLDSNLTGLKLAQFKPINKKLYQTSTASVSKWIQLYRYNKILQNVKVEPLNPSLNSSITCYKNFAADSVFYLVLNDTLVTDTIRLKVSENNNTIDTINFTSHLSKKMTSKAVFKLLAPPEIYVTDSIFIATNSPCVYNKELISVFDTLHKKPVLFTVTSSLHGIKIIPEKQLEKSPLKTVCLPGAITSTITKKTNDTISTVCTYLPVEKMGSIQLGLKKLELNGFTNPVCVLLMDGKYLTKQQVSLQNPTLNFELLKPANYSFYIFNDDDKNGIWSPGDFDLKKQSEKISWYAQPVKVKANWTQDLTWVF